MTATWEDIEDNAGADGAERTAAAAAAALIESAAPTRAAFIRAPP